MPNNTTSPDLTPAIVDNANQPKSFTQDGTTAVQQSIPDQIAADRYAKSQAAASVGLGYRRVRLRPGNNADVDRC